MVRIKVQTRDVERQVTQLQEDLKDFRPLWSIIRREFLITNIMNIFASDGKGTWDPTSRPNPILRDTRRLFRSYTIPGAPGNINRETATKLIWGSDVHYAQYHEYADRNPAIPVRAVLGLLLDPGEQTQLNNLIERWVSGLTRRSR